MFQAVQGKQGGLVKRLDELDQENSDLRDQLAELEDCREEANEAVEKASTAQRGIQCQLKEQEVNEVIGIKGWYLVTL